MGINILVKFFTSNTGFTAIVCFLIIFLSACQSGRVEEYIRPDYTDNEILENEISLLEKTIIDSPIHVLWHAHLLFAETESNAAKNLYLKTLEYIYETFYFFINEEKWFKALELSSSVISMNAYTHELLKASLSAEFITAHQMAQISYNSLPQLSTEDDTASTMSTYTKGVVTVWVDLGVKVEGGRGFANRKLGSGFFIDERGYIITNHHVIEELVDPEYEGYSRLYIKLSTDNETRIPAKVIGWDKDLDIALIKTEVPVPYVFTLGTSENLEVGDSIFAIGSPVGLENTITSGIISAFDRNLLSTAAVMQIDAAINTGNSGGPIINTRGDVQVVVFARLTSLQGLIFAIPIEYVKSIISPLYSSGEVKHSWIGAYGRTIKEFPSDLQGFGVEVLYTMPGGSANKAGIERGNIITSLNGIPIRGIEELQFLLIQMIPDTVVTLGVKETEGSIEEIIPMYLEVRPENPGYSIYKRDIGYKMIYPMFGMELIPSSVGNKNQYTIQSIVRGSIADESGFSIHDPVQILRTTITENEDVVIIETFTQKRKSGYFEVSVSVGAPLDSLFLF